MEVGALAPYEQALRAGGPLRLEVGDGRVIELDVSRWLGGVDDADRTVLARCVAPVLDVGCGPGRFVQALHARGDAALGVDIAETAVALTRGQGLPALLRSVFSELPGEGRWPTVLLLDGNIGIGGEPVQLLRRVRSLAAHAGRIVVETHPDAGRLTRLEVRFSQGGTPVGPQFGWAEVGLDALEACARSVSLQVSERWTAGGRQFAALRAG